MLFRQVTVFLSLCLGLAVALPSPSPKGLRRRQDEADDDTPICGRIIEAVNEGYRLFYAESVYECLTSVPFHEAVALRFIGYYNTTMQFQSTLAHLKNPPEGYQQPAFDFFQGMDDLKNNVTSGVFKNQYDFEAALQHLVYSVHDAHVDLSAGVLSAFSFASPWPIVTASIDGKETPKVYFAGDVLDRQENGTEISAISHINGEPVVDFLTKFAALNSVGMLEPHADWNQLMDSPVQDIQGALSIFSGGATFYPGDYLNFTYEDPEKEDANTYWLAVYNNPEFTGPLTTGGDFYNYFVLGFLPASYGEVPIPPAFAGHASVGSGVDDDVEEPPVKTSWFNDSFQAFPERADIVQTGLDVHDGGIITGYFYDDISTGVISIPHFDQYGWDIGNFSKSLNDFVLGAKEHNLSHIIIDLQQNYGGTTGLSLLMFRTLFPGIEPFAGSQRRIHELADVLGSATTRAWEEMAAGNETEKPRSLDFVADEWVVSTRLDAETGSNFSSWEEFRGPRKLNGDDFSLVERYDLKNPTFHRAAFDGWLLSDYLEGNDVGRQAPWAAEDVVILTDGTCSSACALFVELATTQAGARSVVVGGSPKPGPMQAASGTRGARIYSGESLDVDFQWVGNRNETAKSRFPVLDEDGARDTGVFVNYAGFTLRDQLREDDVDTPLQFRYVAADCRIYFTLDNVYNMTILWHDVARAAFEDPSLCVEGSMGYNPRNGSSEAPPKMTAVPIPAPVPAAEFTGDDDPLTQDGLPAAQVKIGKQVQTVICDPASSNPCPLGGVCQPIAVKCSTGLEFQQFACVAQCVKSENKCHNVNDYCRANKNAGETKSDTFGVSSTKTGNSFKGGKVVSGFCQPKVGTAALGCPVGGGGVAR
ncbi:peptidase S41 family protein [Colletotrichum plurivorum]|uniref:Peptidase S41 family protein n=1 Tax=Colletotrichum plurivorum TaxID=2175906 RepID=A0A8H6N5S4_9PEZI|nr:peptidase S41 family protein [Colletotrichum plurivorum]